MKLLDSVSMCRSIMLLRLSMGCLLEIMSQGHSKAVESQSSPDLTRWLATYNVPYDKHGLG